MVGEFTYNPDEINQFSMSRIIGLGLSLLKDIDSSEGYQDTSGFIVNKFINENPNEANNKYQEERGSKNESI